MPEMKFVDGYAVKFIDSYFDHVPKFEF